jgi:hypothetical protein
LQLEPEDVVTDVVTGEPVVKVTMKARTVGFVNSFKYSTEASSDEYIPYYKQAILNAPIIEYYKKLTKKSTITVKHGTIQEFPNTALVGYTWELY